MHYSMVEPLGSNFRMITATFLGVWIFRNFMVYAAGICSFCWFVHSFWLTVDHTSTLGHFYGVTFTFLLQSPQMRLSFLLQFISRWKTFTSHVIYSTPWGGATTASANSVVCLLTFVWHWSHIFIMLSMRVLPLACSKTSVRYDLILNIWKTSPVGS